MRYPKYLHDGGKIGCAEGEGRQPRADGAPAEDKAVDVRRVAAGIQPHAEQNGKKRY